MQPNDLYRYRSYIRHIYMETDMSDIFNEIIEKLRTCCNKSIENIKIDFSKYSIEIELATLKDIVFKDSISNIIRDTLSAYIVQNIPNDYPEKISLLNFVKENKILICESFILGKSLKFLL